MRPAAAVLALGASLLLLLLLPHAAEATCNGTKTHALIGWEGQLSQKQHNVKGRVVIIDDCTFEVRGFTYDGRGPAAFWYGSSQASTSFTAFAAHGTRLNDALVSGPHSVPTTISVTFKAGITWDQVRAISVWCDAFNADFGSVVVPLPAAGTTTTTTTTTTSAALVSTSTRQRVLADLNPSVPMTACATLVSERVNLNWRVDGDFVVFQVDHSLPRDTWFAFGVPQPAANGLATMVGSDITVVGIVSGEGRAFAIDHYISAYSQCNYAGARDNGVCPDFGTASPSSSTEQNAALLTFTFSNGITSITWARRLDTGDSTLDRVIPLGLSPYVWAYGALGAQSTVDLPVILKHTEPTSGQSYKLELGAASACAKAVKVPTSSGPPAKLPVATVTGVTSFDVTTGDNFNYPNGRGWGFSYRLNGLETPVINVVRGVEYTFKVMAGTTHPLYITDDITGGRSNHGEQVFAGSAQSFGTPATPYVLKWTPTASTPSVVYYQCWIHQFFGWKIQVSDPGQPIAPPSPGCPSSSLGLACSMHLLASPSVVMHWTAYGDAAEFALEADVDAWVALGFPTRPNRNGVVASQSGVMPVSLASYSKPALDPTMRLSSSTVTRSSRTTTLRFSRPLRGAGQVELPSTGLVDATWAFGKAEFTFSGAKHDRRGSVQLDMGLARKHRVRVMLPGDFAVVSGLQAQAAALANLTDALAAIGVSPDKVFHLSLAEGSIVATVDLEDAQSAVTVSDAVAGSNLSINIGGQDVTAILVTTTTTTPTTTTTTAATTTTTTTMAASGTGCPKTHPYVGFKGTFSELQHRWRGEVEILDDCSFRVTGFRYDGFGPAAYWYGAQSESRTDLRAGFRLAPAEVVGAFSGGATMTIELGPGVTWDQTNVISGWCEAARANFGSVTLEAASRPCAESSLGFECSLQAPSGQTLHWTIDATRQLFHGALEAAEDAWLAVAFPETAEQMGPADLVAGSPGQCAATYRLASNARAPPQADPSQTLVQSSITRSNGVSLLNFTRAFDNGGKVVLSADNIHLNWAVGFDSNLVGGTGHAARGSLSVSQANGLGSVGSDGSDIRDQQKTHGILMGIAWAVLLPLGAVFARGLRTAGEDEKQMWFRLHVGTQVVGLVLALVGWFIALAKFEDITDTLHSHGKLGTAVMVMALVQPLNGLLRPHAGPGRGRKLWELAHWLIGQVALLLGAINVFIGVQVMYELQRNDRASYVGAFAGLLCVIALVKDSLSRKAGTPSHSQPARKDMAMANALYESSSTLDPNTSYTSFSA